MGREAQLGLRALAFAGQLRLRVGRRSMCLVAALFAVKVHRRVARVVRGLVLRPVLPLEALERCTGLDERAVQVKWSLLISRSARACSTTARKNSPATLCSSSRSRFFVNTVASNAGSIMSMSRNHRYKRLYAICSQSCRSLRTVYSAMSSCALSNRSGGIDGRPTDAYIASNVGDSFPNTSSASFLIARIGWSVGTTVSGDISINIDPCCGFSPRMSRT
jgi:hypothetical protein